MDASVQSLAAWPGDVDEARHLRGDPSEARAGADDDGVVLDELLDPSDRRALIKFEVGAPRHLLGHQFGTRFTST
jgi:hypothetical protein